MIDKLRSILTVIYFVTAISELYMLITMNMLYIPEYSDADCIHIDEDIIPTLIIAIIAMFFVSVISLILIYFENFTNIYCILSLTVLIIVSVLNPLFAYVMRWDNCVTIIFILGKYYKWPILLFSSVLFIDLNIIISNKINFYFYGDTTLL